MEKGLVHIYCGDGKGKTTCAVGLAVRCAGAGGKVLWFQFLKENTSGERAGLAQLGNIDLLPGYENIKFTFMMTEEEKEEAKVFYKNKMQEISQLIKKQEYDLLILDEVFGAISTDMIKEEDVYQFLLQRPVGLEVVLAGRDPSERMLEYADYVSNMQKVKHPFDLGVSARRMIEY